jgi:hypothetical protein
MHRNNGKIGENEWRKENKKKSKNKKRNEDE